VGSTWKKWSLIPTIAGGDEDIADQRDIFSSSIPPVRGPNAPMAIITMVMASPMKLNTPSTPKLSNVKEIRKAVQIAEKRLQE